MSSVGVITFHASYNCGSILQALALRSVLEGYGHSVSIINFSSIEQQRLYSVLYRTPTPRHIVKNLLCLPGIPRIAAHYRQYADYIRDAFDVEQPPIATSQDLPSDAYDVYIAGGDQIWNVRCPDFSTAYMLDFVCDAKKVAYAPSLGATNMGVSPDCETYRALLGRFDALSCRETNGKRWLEELVGRPVELVLDPTMLLDADEWRSVAKPLVHRPEFDYIFYYAFSYSNAYSRAVSEVAERLELKVVVIDAKEWYVRGLYRYRNFVLLQDGGPNAFLNLVADAKFVVTMSFHGTVFSVLYRKQFVYLDLEGHDPDDDRTSCLLEMLGLGARLTSVGGFGVELLSERIDYEDVFRRVAYLRESSHSYLADAVGVCSG